MSYCEKCEKIWELPICEFSTNGRLKYKYQVQIEMNHIKS